ncbi:hypothetical protein BS50DRAFT_291681 [Corynespora cassiicola Philippines]|uniref:Lipocalin-like domain-containing protein n=1 Tax=Corynespora cassiicola Philippines TaxID=1448308 RepID=A0A2T2NW19_CORCC|nr:hypothetical protein BS50DRAFT_291681 [Corynespora cassiicola Philippines]
MAAPQSKTIRDLSGKWILHKTLSDDPDAVLALQGIGWLTRKAVGLATVTQHLRCYTAPAEDGSSGEVTHRVLDWQFRPHSDWLFGDLQGKSRFNTLAAIREENKGKGKIEEDAKFLTEGWLPETEEGEVVESFVDNEKAGWTGWQVWGFADVEVNGKKERWLCRRFAVRKGDKVVKVRLCYEWNGDLDA